MRRAARLMRSASPTDVPPNFITTVPDTGRSLGKRQVGSGGGTLQPAAYTGVEGPPGQVDELPLDGFKSTMGSARVQPQEAGVASIFNRTGLRRMTLVGLLASIGAFGGSAVVHG